MAQLTWRNVDAPDVGRAADILNSVAANFKGGMTGISDAFKGARNLQKNNRSAAGFDILADIQGGDDVAAALAKIDATVNPMDRSAELIAAIAGARGTALGYDSTKANTTSTIDSNNRANTTQDRKIAAEDQLAAMAAGLVGAREGAYNGTQGSDQGNASGTPFNDRELLARTIQAEAGGEGANGMLAVGSVIRNRLSSGKHGGSLRDVILAPGQFSAWNGVTGYAGGKGALDMNGMKPSADAYAQADTILSGNYSDPTGGAVNYYNPKQADPEWGAKAGGNWTSIGNHVFGNAGGGGAPSGPPSIVGLIPKDNKIDPATLLSMVDQNNTTFNEGETNRDANRSRDYNFDRGVIADTRSDKAYNDGLQATELAVSSALNATTPEEVKKVIAERTDLPAEVRTAALAQVDGLPVADMRALKFDPSRTAPEGTGAAVTALDGFANRQNVAVGNDTSVAVLNDALSLGNNGTPALDLLAATKGTDDYLGVTQNAMQTVSKTLGISDAQAAALLKRTAEQAANWVPLVGWNGEHVRWDTDKAIALGKEFLTPEAIERASNLKSHADANLQAVENIKGQMGQLQAVIDRGTDQGKDVSQFQRSYDLLLKKANELSQADVAGQVPSKKGSAPGEAAFKDDPQTLVTDMKASTGVPGNELKTRAESVAVDVISEMTGIPAETLKGLDRADLQALISRMEAQANLVYGPAGEEVKTKVQQVKAALERTN